jgi:hypothetical protein
MPIPRLYSRSLMIGLGAIALPVAMLLAVGLGAAGGKTHYELVKDLFVPLIGPMVAVLVPVVLFFVIPLGQTRQRLALDLCSQYFSEEMREARNTGWRHFVTEQRQLPPMRRAERLNHFLSYLTEPEVNRGVSAELDAVYQKASRVLDFFTLIDGCLARGAADPDIVRDFLLYYYLWWRDEIMDPLRNTRRITTLDPRYRPVWWDRLAYLDALSGRAAGRAMAKIEGGTG